MRSTKKYTVNCPTCLGFGATVAKRSDGTRCFVECHQCSGEERVPKESPAT